MNTGTTWLNLLPLELQDIRDDNFIGPHQTRIRGDYSVGEMRDSHKRIYTLVKNLEREAEQMIIDAKYSMDRDIQERAPGKIAELQYKIQALLKVFWILIREDFKLWDKDDVGVRKGFQVVWTVEDRFPSPVYSLREWVRRSRQKIKEENGPNWFKNLLEKIEKISEGDCQEPSEAVKPGDNIAGDMTDGHKKLFTLWCRLQKVAEQSYIDARYLQDDDRKKQADIRAHELLQKADAFREIFWISINDHFEIWEKPSVGVRKGFLVVWSEMSLGNILDFLRDISE